MSFAHQKSDTGLSGQMFLLKREKDPQRVRQRGGWPTGEKSAKDFLEAPCLRQAGAVQT